MAFSRHPHLLSKEEPYNVPCSGIIVACSGMKWYAGNDMHDRRCLPMETPQTRSAVFGAGGGRISSIRFLASSIDSARKSNSELDKGCNSSMHIQAKPHSLVMRLMTAELTAVCEQAEVLQER